MHKTLKRCFAWMARRAAAHVLPLAIGAGLTAPAFAALLGVTLNHPLISYDNQGTTTYAAVTDQFLVTASPLAIRLAPTAAPVLITPIPGLGETLVINVTVGDTGALTGGAPGDDLLVVGEVDLGATGFFSGVLLTGEVTGFGFQDSGGSTDLYDFTFTVTGGQLAFLYPSGVGVEVTSEQSDFTGDFTLNFGGEAKGTLGALPVAALGDRVWEDRNANGIQDCEDTNANGILGDVDPLDPANPAVSDQGFECGDRANGGAGIAGVPVNLFQPDANGDCTIDLSRQVVTGTDGIYLFEDLEPGDYCVQFDITALPDDFCTTDGFALGAPRFTALNVGGDPAIDSDADPATGTTDGLTLGAGEINRTLDAGILCPAKIGDRVWEDSDQDGLQDGGEAGVAGVTVNLFGCGPDGIAGTADDVDTGESRVTDAIDGLYMFGAEPGVFDLRPGKYYVKFDSTTFPPGYDFTAPKVGADDTIDSDCLPPDGITACRTLGSRGINLNRDCGIVAPPPECDLELDKQCRVEPEPTADFDKCKGKLQQFTVIWDGEGAIEMTGLNMGTTSASGAINPGDEVTFFGPYSDNDVIVDIVSLGGVPGETGQSTFHVSCSDADFNSPDDCGKLAGDGKDKAGFINLWRLEGFIDAENRVLNCTPEEEGEFADNCSFLLQSPPSCDSLKDTKHKLKSLTFEYTGGGCDESDNDQDQKKAVCTTTPSGDMVSGPITVRAAGNEKFEKDVYLVDPTLVYPAATFEVSADKFKSTSFIEIVDGSGVTELNELHTSCSQPLAVGDVFGSLTLVAINGVDGGADVTYQYIVTNNGDPLTDVVVTDVPLGDIGGPVNLGTNDSETFTKLAHLLGTTVNTATATGFLANGEVCSASDTVTVEAVKPPPAPAECKELKPIDALILEYDASQAGGRTIEEVAWYRDKYKADDPSKNLINTTGPVIDGQLVTFDGFAEADAKNDVDFFIQFTDGSTATSRFHRSCSDEEMNDISDCGTLQGDGKENDSGLNTWVLRDLAGNGKVLGCP
jgi:hypothetical protein